MNKLEKTLEDAWREFSRDDLIRDIEKLKQRIREKKAVLAFAEYDLEIGERVLEVSNRRGNVFSLREEVDSGGTGENRGRLGVPSMSQDERCYP